jgi:hypothetical protein
MQMMYMKAQISNEVSRYSAPPCKESCRRERSSRLMQGHEKESSRGRWIVLH